MHDVAWRGIWICVRSKDAQKQLARTSLNCLVINENPSIFCDFCGLKISLVIGRDKIKSAGILSCSRFYNFDCKPDRELIKVAYLYN